MKVDSLRNKAAFLLRVVEAEGISKAAPIHRLAMMTQLMDF